MASYLIESPAKLNLYLEVLKRRPDNYHDIVTLFERIDLLDTLTLSEKKEGITVKSDSRALPCDEKNLAHKAASALIKKLKINRGISIYIRKRIPVSAGLGGGSSNAASVILGLNRLWRLGLSRAKMMEIGGSLGADVPFFINETPFAIGRGRGDIIEPLAIKANLWHILLNPGIDVPTRQIYEKLNDFPLTPKRLNVNIYDYLNGFNRIEKIQPLIFNRLKIVALGIFPKLIETEQALRAAGATLVSMSGSGPTFFAITDDGKEAARIKERLTIKRGWKVFIARTFRQRGEMRKER